MLPHAYGVTVDPQRHLQQQQQQQQPRVRGQAVAAGGRLGVGRLGFGRWPFEHYSKVAIAWSSVGSFLPTAVRLAV